VWCSDGDGDGGDSGVMWCGVLMVVWCGDGGVVWWWWWWWWW